MQLIFMDEELSASGLDTFAQERQADPETQAVRLMMDFGPQAPVAPPPSKTPLVLGVLGALAVGWYFGTR